GEKGLGRGGAPVPHPHAVAGVDQTTRHGGPHRAEADEADLAHQAFQTVFTLQNSRMPSAASSRPKPESLMPPNGSSGYETVMPLTKTAPASNSRMNAASSSGSLVHAA